MLTTCFTTTAAAAATTDYLFLIHYLFKQVSPTPVNHKTQRLFIAMIAPATAASATTTTSTTNNNNNVSAGQCDSQK